MVFLPSFLSFTVFFFSSASALPQADGLHSGESSAKPPHLDNIPVTVRTSTGTNRLCDDSRCWCCTIRHAIVFQLSLLLVYLWVKDFFNTFIRLKLHSIYALIVPHTAIWKHKQSIYTFKNNLKIQKCKEVGPWRPTLQMSKTAKHTHAPEEWFDIFRNTLIRYPVERQMRRLVPQSCLCVYEAGASRRLA